MNSLIPQMCSGSAVTFPPRDICLCLGTFLCHSGQNSGGGGALGVPWVEVKDAARYSVVGRAVPTAKSCSF